MNNMTPAQRVERLRAHLMEQEKTRAPQASSDNASYPFWNIAEGATATVRFLPDADPDSPTFWATKEIINLPFSGQVGGDYPTDRPVIVKVPCVDMFGDSCPIIAETRPWWKQGPEMEEKARKYWKKKTFIFQGFVVVSPFEESNVPENPIRRFVFTPSIFDIIKSSLMNPEMEDLPIDYVGGRDFKITKSRKGEYANYANSTWSFRTRALNEIENVAIQKYGLFNLADFRGTRPDADGIAMIRAMFHDSVAGKKFDFDSYGKVYRAYSDRNSPANADLDALTTPNAVRSMSSTRGTDDDDLVETEIKVKPALTTASTPPSQASDILERIRKKTMAEKS